MILYNVKKKKPYEINATKFLLSILMNLINWPKDILKNLID